MPSCSRENDLHPFHARPRPANAEREKVNARRYRRDHRRDAKCSRRAVRTLPESQLSQHCPNNGTPNAVPDRSDHPSEPA